MNSQPEATRPSSSYPGPGLRSSLSLLLLAAAPALAVPITSVQEVSFPATREANEVSPFRDETVLSAIFLPFDPALGVLSNVDVSFSVLGTAVVLSELEAGGRMFVLTGALLRGAFGEADELFLMSDEAACPADGGSFCTERFSFADLAGTVSIGFGSDDIVQLAHFAGDLPVAIDGVFQTDQVCLTASDQRIACASVLSHIVSGTLTVAYTYEPFVAPTPVPEPPALSLLGLALAGLTVVARRKERGHR